MKPSYDELFETVRLLSEANFRLMEENRRLQKRIAELEERLNLDSQNSSKPPSSDQKKNKQAPKGGARKGHAGHHRKLYSEDQISKRVTSALTECEHCGSKTLEKKAPQIFQQVELPEIIPFVTQIELEKARCCGCNRNLIAPFPKEFDNSSFGPKLISFIGACSSIYRMSKRTTKILLKTLCNIEISVGSIPAMERSLQSSHDSLSDKVNETSFRQNARTHYVWTATTKQEALIGILPRRNLESLEMIPPRNHPGITVTDRYQVYAYRRHQYCLAHIKRDFKKFSERASPDREIGNRALFELKEIFKACRMSCRKTMQQHIYYRKKRLQEILYDALGNGSEYLSSFADRLLNHFHKLFLFTRYSEVECTNNAAERSLRHIVLWRKTSYGTQSDGGSRFMERAVSIWMTLKKQGRHTIPYFEQGYRATFQPGVQPPAILPH
ncbi:MAG: IS66 family transposase [Chlamydiales bacterium]